MVLRRRPGRSHDSLADACVIRRPHLLAGEDLPPLPRQKRSVERRVRLMSAALDLFGKKGYAATSIDDIARRARLPVGSFYQHFRSKRQLLLSLMDELLHYLGRLDLRPQSAAPSPGAPPSGDAIRAGLRALFSTAFSADLRYLGAYRAWREAALSDPSLARKQSRIHAWTTLRTTNLLRLLGQLPGARQRVDVTALARVLDSIFWSLLAEASRLRKVELDQWLDAATHLIYHATFTDPEN
jgi:AcrR family transcriptional regulator